MDHTFEVFRRVTFTSLKDGCSCVFEVCLSMSS